MKRLSSIVIWSLALASLAACRSTLGGGVPGAASSGPMQSFSAMEEAAGARAPERTMPFKHGVGSSNTVTADMPVSRPDTTPCTVTLFYHYTFKNFSNRTFPFNPPSACPGPWAKVVFNFDLRVTKGVQYDRTGILWVDGAVIYFGSTAEPSSTLAPHWHVERDVTELSALFQQHSVGQVELWNCYCPPTYDGYQVGKATLQFYPADKKFPAPAVPDEVIGLPYSPPLGSVATMPQGPMQFSGTLPTNITRAYLDLYLESQNKEEQWFMCVPDSVWDKSGGALGFCRNTPFREGVVSVNGQPAGLAPINPWIYTGGMDPYLWFPIPGVQTLEFVPSRVDLTPFAAVLSSGSQQTVNVSVFRAYNNFSGAGDLLLYLDHKQSSVTGAVTQDTAPVNPDLTVNDGLTYGSGSGLFGGSPAQGTVATRSRNNYTISGYVNTSSGKVTTTVSANAIFVNNMAFDYTSSRYVQLLAQNSHFDTSSTTQSGSTSTTTATSYDFPFDASYPILPMGTGFKLPIKIYQSYRFNTAYTDGHTLSTQTSNTVASKDTMLFNSSFSWIGVRNGSSVQLYTYQSNKPNVCYGKQIESKNNVVTAIHEPGCTAQPPPRRRPRI
jgi:Peptide N-acetyl-beta-D-glucosaminyl asparaginase amidase A